MPSVGDLDGGATVRASPNHAFPVRVHGGAVLLVGFANFVIRDPAAALTLGGIVCFVAFILLAIHHAKRAPLVMSPLSFFFGWYAVGLGLAAIVMAGRIRAGEPILFSIELVPYESIVNGYLLFLIGTFFFHLGALWFGPLRPSGSNGNDRALPIFGLLFIVWAIGIAVRLVPMSVGAIGGLRGLLYWASTAALAVFALTARRLTPRFWMAFAIGSFLDIALVMSSNSKAYIMFSFLPLLWLLAVRRDMRRYLAPVCVALILFYLGIVAPTIESTRRWWAQTGEELTVKAFFVTPDVSQASLQRYSRAFFQRQFEPIALAYIENQTRVYGHLHGSGMTYLAYSFIPRALWPEKPNVTRGRWFTTYTGFSRSEETATTSTGQTAAGELYLNFGLPGLVAGMFILGLIFGKLWTLATLRPDTHPFKMLLYILLAIGVVNMQEFGSTLVAYAQRYVFFGVAIWMTASGSRASAGKPLVIAHE